MFGGTHSNRDGTTLAASNFTSRPVHYDAITSSKRLRSPAKRGDSLAIGTDAVSDRCACSIHMGELIHEANHRSWQSGNRDAGETTPQCIRPIADFEAEFHEAVGQD